MMKTLFTNIFQLILVTSISEYKGVTRHYILYFPISGMGIDHNYCFHSDFNGATRFKHVTNAIVLRYSSKGETKTGIVRIRLGLSLDEEDLEYRNIEYSDHDLRIFLKENPSVLTKIHFSQSKLSTDQFS